MSVMEKSTTIEASPRSVWMVLADFGALATWVPMMQHSCLLSDQTEGVGTVRRVQIGRQTLVERVNVWEPANVLAYAIEGLPPMVGAATNTWRITANATGCDVKLTTEIHSGRNPVKTLIASKVLERMAVASESMLSALAATATATENREQP